MAYEEVPADEAVDLILTLPSGSRWVASTQPALAWTREQELAADAVDALRAIIWGLGMYDRDEMPEPPRVDRPSARAARERREAEARERRERSARARERMEGERWVEV